MSNTTERKLKPIPKVGEIYHFFDDGKLSASRHYMAKCVDVIPYEKASDVKFENYEGFQKEVLEIFDKDYYTLQDCFDNRGGDWLFANTTDYFVVCKIPGYDDDLIYFVRTKDGGWFSIETTNGWQGGRLDIDGTLFEEAISYIKDEKNLRNYKKNNERKIPSF